MHCRPGDRVTVTEDTTADLHDRTVHLTAGMTVQVLDASGDRVKVTGDPRPVWIPARLVKRAGN